MSDLFYKYNPDGTFTKVPNPSECVVCGSRDKIELHHWAPIHLFKDEAEKWPVSFLCQKCHVKWHQLVDLCKAAKTAA